MLAFVWHFSILAPGVKEFSFSKKNKFSLLGIVYRINFYLQMFIYYPKFKFTKQCVRALSPFLFTGLLFLVGGNGNLLFTLLGSYFFELMYYLLIGRKIENNGISFNS